MDSLTQFPFQKCIQNGKNTQHSYSLQVAVLSIMQNFLVETNQPSNTFGILSVFLGPAFSGIRS